MDRFELSRPRKSSPLPRKRCVTKRTTLTGSYQGKPITVVLRFTDVFTKRDGHWRVVASQGTQVTK